ncbi:MAG: response regulator transcription factor [Pseudomonadales bacterium]
MLQSALSPATTEPMKAASNFPNQFQRQSLTLVNELVDITSSVFYLVAPEMRHRGVVLNNLNADVEKEYQKKFKHLDPLNPAKFKNTDDRVVTIDAQIPFAKLRQTIYYQDFMLPHDHRYVADMFFRFQGEIIAVLSMLRHESLGSFTGDELTLLCKVQPFLEYTLNTVYLPKRVTERQSIKEKYALTARELDVLELIIAGASNKLIASELGLGLATVKTHLLHIFQKTGVSSRTELLSRIVINLATT